MKYKLIYGNEEIQIEGYKPKNTYIIIEQGGGV